jgi:hypothetical protein
MTQLKLINDQAATIIRLTTHLENARAIIDALTHQNTQLKMKLLETKSELPTDDSTRRSYFNEFIHNQKNTKEFDCKVG